MIIILVIFKQLIVIIIINYLLILIIMHFNLHFSFIYLQKITIHFIIQNFAKQGYSIAIDADCAGHNVAETIKKAAQSIGAQTIWIHINPPEEFILNKLKNYKHTWLFKDSDDALASYYRRKPLHEELDFPFAYTFDTSKNNVAEQIEDAASVIDALVKE